MVDERYLIDHFQYIDVPVFMNGTIKIVKVTENTY